MSVEVSGEITTILDALDQGVFDPGGLGLLGLVGPTYEDEHYPEDRMYRTFAPQGVSVLYEGTPDAQKASNVFVYITPQDGAAAYRTPDRLIDGLALSSADRSAVVDFFGEPADSGGAFDIFRAGERFLHFEYDGDTLTLVTAMVSVPGM